MDVVDDLQVNESGNEEVAFNPLTGAVVELTDFDSVIGQLDAAKKQIADLYLFKNALEEFLVGVTEKAGETKSTRRVSGSKYTAKIEVKRRNPSGSILKEALNSYPELGAKYLSISSVKLKLREWDKLKATVTSDPAVDQFRKMVVMALEQGSDPKPTVSVEAGE